jgi:hypothetical protein
MFCEGLSHLGIPQNDVWVVKKRQETWEKVLYCQLHLSVKGEELTAQSLAEAIMSSVSG